MMYQAIRIQNIIKSCFDLNDRSKDRTDEESTILFLLETKYIVRVNSGCIWHKQKNDNFKLAGTTDKNGYRKMLINGKEQYIHRLIWLYCNGVFPRFETDHIDGNKSNNAITNLRDVTKSENQKNRKLRKDNKTGYNGVFYNKKTGKYQVTISLEGKQFNLGTYENIEEAIEARELSDIALGYTPKRTLNS